MVAKASGIGSGARGIGAREVMSVTRPKKPVLRRYGRLIVRLDDDGLSIRGHRKKKWRRVSWPEVGWLISTAGEGSRVFSEMDGAAFLKDIGAA